MKKKISLLALTAALVISLTGCFNPAFYNIMQDVPPEEATIFGIVRSVSRYTVGSEEYLVINANDGIQYKKADDNSHGTWKKADIPFSLLKYDYAAKNPDGTSGVFTGEQILKVLADSDYLYVVTTTYRNNSVAGRSDPDEVKIWTSKVTDWNSISWTQIALPDRESGVEGDTDTRIFQYYEQNDYLTSRFNVFSTNAVEKAHRAVYVRSGSAKSTIYYSLSNGSISKTSISSVVGGSADKPVNGVAYLNGYKFFESSAVCTNEASGTPATIVYFGKPGDSKLYTYDGSTVTTCLNCGDELSCIAVSKDSLIIGRAHYSSLTATSGGAVRVLLNNEGVPAKSLSSFNTNASSQLSSAYLIFTLLCVNPSQDEADATFYSSIGFRGTGASTSVTYENVGLWSYYPERGNWNRE